MQSNNPLSDKLYEFLSGTKWVIRIKLKTNKIMYANKDERNE